jgi:hypothetical protein
MPELMQFSRELHKNKILNELYQFFRAGNLRAFHATAERILREQSGNPMVRSVIVERHLIIVRNQEEAAIAVHPGE